MGRPWLAFWMLPYPNMRGLAVGQFPLAPGVGRLRHLHLLPDLGRFLVRRADPRSGHDPRSRRSPVGENGSAGVLQPGLERFVAHWHRYETVYLLLAGLATPLVFSVHTIVSMDFATAVIPGWHTTIFPPYFVAGAIFSGLAMVLTLMIIARKVDAPGGLHHACGISTRCAS